MAGDAFIPSRKFRRKYDKIFKEASALDHIKADAPPTLLIYNSREPLDETSSPGIGLHHPALGDPIREKLDKLGIPCELIVLKKGDDVYLEQGRHIVRFFKKHGKF